MVFPLFRLIAEAAEAAEAAVTSIANSCRTQWVQNQFLAGQAQYTAASAASAITD